MQPRMRNPAIVLSDAMEALQALGAAVGQSDVPETTILLVLTRASQINGCAVCLDGHSRSLRTAGETDERLSTLAASHRQHQPVEPSQHRHRPDRGGVDPLRGRSAGRSSGRVRRQP